MITKNHQRIFVIDDDPIVQRTFTSCLSSEGLNAFGFSDAESALDEMSNDVSVILLDLFLPRKQGLPFLSLIRRQFPGARVVVISQSNDVHHVVEAIRRGADDFLRKPVDAQEVISKVRQLLGSIRTAQEDNIQPSDQRSLELILGKTVVDQLGRASNLKSTLLLNGESGTGKSAAASWIHQKAEGTTGKLVSLNCSSLPIELAESELFGHVRGSFTSADRDRPGKVEMASNGTLFLDEIGDLPMALQPKLLTFLQTREASRVGSNSTYTSDARIIAATHRDLIGMCEAGQFREDLFYRLNVLPVTLSPLGDRIEEIPTLCELLLKRVCSRFECAVPQISESAMNKLISHRWPGNIRELENTLERAVAFLHGEQIVDSDIRLARVPGAASATGASLSDSSPEILTLDAVEKQTIERALVQCSGNKSLTAKRLGISERSIYNKMKRLGIRSSFGTSPES